MPELPEVQTVVSDLNSQIAGFTFLNVEIFWPRYIAHPTLQKFTTNIKNKKILKITRRAKYILYHLSSDYILMQHLRMTGRTLIKQGMEPATKHTHVIFTLSGGHKLHIEDTRKFGRLWLFTKKELESYLEKTKLGPEPLGKTISPQTFAKTLKIKNGCIKTLLLNQSVIAGLGNIYADEALFQAKIHPIKKASSVSTKKLELLFNCIQDTLKKAINSRGTTFSDYLDGRGNAGKYVEFLNVYGRSGQPCKDCKTTLKKTTIASRGTVYCPSCQKN